MSRTISLAMSLAALCLFLILSATPVAKTSAAAATTVRWAYYVPNDPTSLASLRQRSGDLDYVGLHWASMREDGSVDVRPNPEALAVTRSIGAKPILSVTAGSGGGQTAHAFLASPESRAAAAGNLAGAMGDYDGISIDFEGLYPEDRDSLTAFMADLAARLRPAGKLVTMALSAKTGDTSTGWAGALDYAALAPHADIFVLMAYGYRTAQSSVPGSTAPMSWVEASAVYAASRIPAQKLFLGVPFYGYDWDTTAGPPARALRYAEAAALAAQNGAQIQHDPSQASARFTYSKDGKAHDVWFEDQATLQPRLALAARLGLAGVAAWRLGHEDPAVWDPVATPPPPATGDPNTGGQDAAGRTWYFAEGSTAAPFQTWLLLQNPGSAPATVRISLMLESGATVTRDLLVAPTARQSVYANQILKDAAFSTRIDSDRPIFVERAVYAGFDGHDVTAVASPSKIWYLAEGSTSPPFHTWILIQNPGSQPAVARLTFQKEDGSTAQHAMLVAPNSRASLFANQVIPSAAFSTRVESDQPVIVERAMYRFPGNAATGVTGVSTTARTWFFAGGLPAPRSAPVDGWLLLQNPNGYPVTAAVTFFGADGRTAMVQRYLPPTSRQSLFVNQLFDAPSYGIRVEATGEIIAERSVFIGAAPESGGEPQGAYATQGATRLGTVWALPEGSTSPPFTERISVLNPNASMLEARFEFMLEGGQTATRTATVPARTVFDLEVETVVRSAAASARVVTSLPSAVERTMFWTKEGRLGAHDTMGIRLE